MQTMRLVVSVSLAALAVCACSKAPGDPAAKAAAGASAMPTAAAAGPETLTTLPTPTPGLWKQTISSDGMKQVITMCLDASYAKKAVVDSQAMGAKQCAKTDVQRGLDGSVSFSSECDMEHGKVVSKGRITGDLSSHYSLSDDITVGDSAPHHMNIEAERQGDCPAGWKGGDVSIPGLGKVNMEAMRKKAEQAKGFSGQVKFKP